jgi:short-subunit dehydrogenase
MRIKARRSVSSRADRKSSTRLPRLCPEAALPSTPVTSATPTRSRRRLPTSSRASAPPTSSSRNAGISQGALTQRDDLPTFRAIFDTNVVGIVNTFAPFVAAMRAAREGALVGIASVAGFRGLPGSGAYSASKAAAIAYLESLRIEERASGVSVLTICPGYIATAMTARNPYPMPFLLEPDEAARRIARAIERRQRFYVLPWPMAIVGAMLRIMPRPLYDAVFAHAPRKPRVS